MKALFPFIFLLFINSVYSQSKLNEMLDLLPYTPAKEGTNIYLLKAPEWDKTISNSDGIRVDNNGGDNIFSHTVVFGDRQYGNRKYSFWKTLDVRKWTFSDKRETKVVSLEGYHPTSKDDHFVKVNFDNNSKTLEILTMDFTDDDSRQNTFTQADLLEAIDRAGFQITGVTYGQCQDKDYVLLDIEMEAEQLEGRVIERHWITINANDFTIRHDVLQPLTIPSQGIYVLLMPYGMKDSPPSFLSIRDMTSFNNGYTHHIFKPGIVSYTHPGKDLIIAKYRNHTFWDNREAVLKIDMNKGERSYFKPPRESMEMSANNFYNFRAHASLTDKKDTMWMCRNSLKEQDYEVLFSYNEKEGTYITVGHNTYQSTAVNVQLVLQNTKGEYFGRNTNPAFQHYRIRKMGTNEIIHEYALLSSMPLKISHDERYMVFLEGTPNNNIITLRELTTGKLIDSAPGLLSTTSHPLLQENSDGILVSAQQGSEMYFSLLEYEKSEEAISISNEKKTYEVDLSPNVAPQETKNYTYTKDGLLAPGNEIDKRFCHYLFWNGKAVGYSKDGVMSPRYNNFTDKLEDYFSEFYSWYAGLQYSRNVGMWLNYYDDNNNQVHAMIDWHGNYIIKPNSKYRFRRYLSNGLLWLREVKDESKNYVWDTEDMSLTRIPVKDKLSMIFQTRDNRLIFPLLANGELYKMILKSNENNKIADNINWVTPFYLNNRCYMMAHTKDTRKAGVINEDGEIILPMEYDGLQLNIVTDNPNIFAFKNNEIIVFNMETRESKVLKSGIERNEGWRRAFGKYGYYKLDDRYVVIDKDGNEILQLEVEDFYGQPDFSMVKEDGKWYFMDEEGKNQFNMVFDDIYSFYNGLALVVLEGKRNAYINYDGEIEIGPFFIHKQE